MHLTLYQKPLKLDVNKTLHLYCYNCTKHMSVIADYISWNCRHYQMMVSMEYHKLGGLEPYQDLLFNDCDRQRRTSICFNNTLE